MVHTRCVQIDRRSGRRFSEQLESLRAREGQKYVVPGQQLQGDVTPALDTAGLEREIYFRALAMAPDNVILLETKRLVRAARKVAWRLHVQARTTAVAATLRVLARSLGSRYAGRTKSPDGSWVLLAHADESSPVEVLRLDRGPSRTFKDLSTPFTVTILRSAFVDMDVLGARRQLVASGGDR